ncbi:MAG: nucleotidyltransferase domain-containing protein [Anaerolineales bacterium]|nr:nucleotidyltransferase domain-containing protein [Anaerolineales bacterium]
MQANRVLTPTDWQNLEQLFVAYPNVIAAWVFGSAQVGSVRPGGDVDVAVLFEKRPLLDELTDLRAAIQDALDFDAIDLLILNGAAPIIRFEGISGRAIFCRDLGKRADFASLTAREYEDSMAFLAKGMAYRQSAIKSPR